jgi:threonine dehydrogenase-like Zn-dependent dehydrogenase
MQRTPSVLRKGALTVPLWQGPQRARLRGRVKVMRAAIFHEPRRVEAGDRPDAGLREPTDAVVRVVLACVCGSDLWYYRGDSPFQPGPIGHEFIGVVEDTGSEVSEIKKGALVIAPFGFCDNTCPHCRHGITSACMNGGFYPANGDGGQGEAVRVPLADGALVPGGSAPARAYIPELLPDVLDGRINPGRVLDYETDLNGISDAYAAMDERRAIKSLVRVGSL